MNFHLGPHADVVEGRVGALRSEDAAGRIWKQDASFWRGDSERRALVGERLGWLDISYQMRDEVVDLRQFAEQVRASSCTDVVLLGMGGSSLAPEVLRAAFGQAPAQEAHPAPTLHVLDTTDPAKIAAVTGKIDLLHALFFVSSKSGTTLEALTLFAYFFALVEPLAPERAGEHFVAVTDPGTPLQELARKHHFRRIFSSPPDIGGRYSALSYFGLAPAAVIGIDVEKLLERALAEAESTRAADSEALRLGAMLGELALAGRDKATFVMAPEVASFGLWVEQLIAESTGKLGRGIVPVVGEPLGTPEQYGDDRFFIQLRMASGGPTEADAAVDELIARGFPFAVVEFTDPYDLGREFFRWEFAVAVAGRVLDINPFDQPDVQESKDNTNRVLAEFERTGNLDAESTDADDQLVTVTAGGAVVRASDAPAFETALAGLLGALTDHSYFAITAYLADTDAAEAAFAGIRASVRNGRRSATTLGFGPRFLHSTGQLHKGGPPAGIFLQITARDQQDLPIPGYPFTFGQFKRAQAIGDFAALQAHGRPVLRVHLGPDAQRGLAQLQDAIRAVLAATGVGR